MDTIQLLHPLSGLTVNVMPTGEPPLQLAVAAATRGRRSTATTPRPRVSGPTRTIKTGRTAWTWA